MPDQPPTANGRSWRTAAPYVVALALAIVLIVVATQRSGPSEAVESLGGQQLKIMAPADPGGGWDQTSREMQASLQDIVGRSEVYNVGGAGGTIGLAQLAQLDGQSNQLMVMGLVMVGAIAANDPSTTLADVTPIAELTTDSQLIVVPADSPLEDVDDLVAAIEDDIDSVSWAGGSAGGAEQILAGLVAQALDLDPQDVNYIAHSGGGEAIATLLSGSATVGVSGVSELSAQVDSGALRAIAVSGEERVPTLPDVPTLVESDVGVTLTNWRGVVAPPGITETQRDALQELMTEMVSTERWQQALESNAWEDAYLTGPDFRTFVAEENQRVEEIVADLGIGRTG